MDASTVYSSYKYSASLLLSWGIYGWFAFFLKRFMKNSAISRQVALFAAQGTGIVGLALMGLNIWRTTGRADCASSTDW